MNQEDPYDESKRLVFNIISKIIQKNKNRVINETLESVRVYFESYQELVSSREYSDKTKWIESEMLKKIKIVNTELKAIEDVCNLMSYDEIWNERKKYLMKIRNVLDIINEKIKRGKRLFMNLEKKKLVNYRDEYEIEKNEQFIQNEFMMQKMMKKKQIEGIKKISVGTDRLIEIANTMKDNTEEDIMKLNQLDVVVERTDNLIKRTTKRIQDIAKKAGNKGKVGCIICLIVVLVFLMFILFF